MRTAKASFRITKAPEFFVRDRSDEERCARAASDFAARAPENFSAHYETPRCRRRIYARFNATNGTIVSSNLRRSRERACERAQRVRIE
jgi:hypothetical protein